MSLKKSLVGKKAATLPSRRATNTTKQLVYKMIWREEVPKGKKRVR